MDKRKYSVEVENVESPIKKKKESGNIERAHTGKGSGPIDMKQPGIAEKSATLNMKQALPYLYDMKEEKKE